MPTFANGTGLIVSTTSGFPLGNVGSYVPATGLTPVDQRIYFRIKNASTEMLYFGFNWETLAPSTPISTFSNIYMHIYDPNNNLVATIHLPGTVGSAGFIGSAIAGVPGAQAAWQTAVIGPHIGLTRATGYTPLSFNPASFGGLNGDYWVNFYQSNDGGATHISGGESMLAKFFDMSVVQGTALVTGRVHCNEWAFSVYNPNAGDIQDPLASSNAAFYAYTTDSVVTKVYFPTNGFQPLSYIIAVNDFGVINTGNWVNDRKSINLPTFDTFHLRKGFDVFLNIPDTTIYHVCTLPKPPSLVNPTISGCPPGPYNIRFNAPQPGDYYMVFDLNGVPGYQQFTTDKYVELINQSPGIITYVWDGKDGLGNPVPANTSFPIKFSFRKGRINVPLYDDELNVNGFSVDAVLPLNAVKTILYWDDTKLTNMGSDCSSNNNNYTGTGYQDTAVGMKSPAHAWNGTGDPTFTIPADSVNYAGTFNNHDNTQCNDFGNARLINTWAWGIDTSFTQTLTLTCISVSGTVWDDANNSAHGDTTNIFTSGEHGTNAGGGLYASLVDPISGTVLSTVQVNSDGTYTLPNCPVGAIGMKIVLSTTAGVPGYPAPAGSIPPTWVNTSPLIRTFNSLSTATNITGQDFGIEQVPNADWQNYTIAVPAQNSLLSLNGAGTSASPGPLSGADPEDGVMGNGKTAVITLVPANESLYYNGVLVTNNTVIPNYNPSKLQVMFTDVSVIELVFSYAFIDAAGQQGTSNTYTINMSTTLATTFASFTGRSTDLGNLLSWTAANETNGTMYTIQRSYDGYSFTSIGRVNGNGNGATVDHTFTDINPIPNTPNYYRLQWTDPSGALAYSNLVTIASRSGNAILDVSPNPFRDQVTVRLSLEKGEKVLLRLLDSKGMLLKQAQYQSVKGVNSLPVEGLSTLPPSVYFIQIVLNEQVFVRKVFN
ncbi:MAG TPA: T9SS type A sorting domain-containing protein [Puia sp.]|jgi:hypothetical protein